VHSSRLRRHVRQIGLDVTDIGIASETGKNSTSRFNATEAYYIAWRIKDMLGYKPPTSTRGVQYSRIRGSDMAVISNYTGQVTEIRRQLLEMFPGQEHVPRQEILEVLTMLDTTSAIQGKEAPIAFYSLVIANGDFQITKNEPLPVGFVASIKNFNVSITRQRIARYIFGAHQLFCYAKRKKHYVSQKYGEFFAHIDKLAADGHILALEETRTYMEGRPQLANASFRKLLRAALDSA
jgi:superfamily I DNA and/or RNA helicase